MRNETWLLLTSFSLSVSLAWTTGLDSGTTCQRVCLTLQSRILPRLLCPPGPREEVSPPGRCFIPPSGREESYIFWKKKRTRGEQLSPLERAESSQDQSQWFISFIKPYAYIILKRIKLNARYWFGKQHLKMEENFSWFRHKEEFLKPRCGERSFL